MTRTPEQWEKILGDLAAPENQNSDQTCAARVLADMIGYRQNVNVNSGVIDVANLANAMVAFARMYFDHGVRP